jgi:hypothetical protein
MITITLSPLSSSVQVGTARQFTATVSPASANQAVTWSLSGTGCSGAACGSLSSNTDNPVTYTAPNRIPSPATITIQVTAAGDPKPQVSTTITVFTSPAIVVSTVPPTVTVAANAVQQFSAGVSNDPFSQGVSWTLSGAGCSGASCGTISKTQTPAQNVDPIGAITFYTAPASPPSPPTVTLTATSETDPSSSNLTTITVIPDNNALLQGRYAFLFNGIDSDGAMAFAGSLNADGAGNITGGVEDINRTTFTTAAAPLSLTGTYVVGTNGKGQMTLTNSQGNSTFRFLINSSGTSASFIEYDDFSGTGTRGAGLLQRQDATAFSLAKSSGDFVMTLFGDLPGVGRTGALGRFSFDSTGNVSGAVLDISALGASSPNLPWTGSFATPDSTSGRGTVKLNANIPAPMLGAITLGFAYYIIAADKLLLIGTDARSSTVPLLSGQVHGQNLGSGFTTASLNGNIIFRTDASSGQLPSTTAAGQIAFSNGNLTGILDQNDAATLTLNSPFTGTYTVSQNGRTTMTFQLDPQNILSKVAYMEDVNAGFILDASGNVVDSGSFQPQAAGAFSPASIIGTYEEICGAPGAADFQNCIGFITLDGSGNWNLTLDTNDTIQFARTKVRNGTYAVASNGRGTMAFATGEQVVFWIVSPNEFISVFTVTPGDNGPDLLDSLKP